MKTILIVDDEYDIASALEMVFELDGYGVRVAYNGRDALACLKLSPTPDIILSDLMMPYMDGYDFVKALRAIPEYLTIPVILASASRLDESRLKAGDWDVFMPKPFDLDRLLNAVRKLLTTKRTPRL